MKYYFDMFIIFWVRSNNNLLVLDLKVNCSELVHKYFSRHLGVLLVKTNYACFSVRNRIYFNVKADK